MKKGIFADRMLAKKRHPRKDVSVTVFGIEIPDQVGDDVIAGLTGNLLLIQRSSDVNSANNA